MTFEIVKSYVVFMLNSQVNRKTIGDRQQGSKKEKILISPNMRKLRVLNHLPNLHNGCYKTVGDTIDIARTMSQNKRSAVTLFFTENFGNELGRGNTNLEL
jgi:hypothetical protein